jgi:CO dehydrogenase/acetyl-CoA synthase alpha subunit
MHLSLKELDTTLGKIRDLDISIGMVREEGWTDPMGPTPFPTASSLRNWDLTLLNDIAPSICPSVISAAFAPTVNAI